MSLIVQGTKRENFHNQIRRNTIQGEQIFSRTKLQTEHVNTQIEGQITQKIEEAQSELKSTVSKLSWFGIQDVKITREIKSTENSSFKLQFVNQNETQQIKKQLKTQGICFLTNIPLDRKIFLQFCSQFGNVLQDRNKTVVSEITPNAKNGLAYSFSKLQLHTDRSSYQNPPRLLLCVCQVAAQVGGQSIFCDGKAVYQAALKCDSQLLKQKVVFQDREGNQIKKQPFTQTKIRCKFTQDAIFPNGDLRQKLKQYCKKGSFQTYFEAGQGYILNNHRWLHGRNEFQGQRKMLRVLME